MPSLRNRVKPFLERLEDRLTPAGTLPWPVAAPAGQRLDLVSTYGEFQQSGGLHYHEGIDILAANGTPVTAIEAGPAGSTTYRVTGINDVPGINSWISISGNGHGWNYVHVLRVCSISRQAARFG